MKKNNFFPVILASILSSSMAIAQVEVIPLPDAPHNAAEFGQTVAKHGKYTVVGAAAYESIYGPSFNPSDEFPNYLNRNGAVWLLSDNPADPVRKYQFLKDTSIPLNETTINYFANPARFGTLVGISNNYVVASLHQAKKDSYYGPALAVFEKVAGDFPTCPKQAYVQGTKTWPVRALDSFNNVVEVTLTENCSGIAKLIPLASEGFSQLDRISNLLKVSDTHIVITQQSTATIFKKNSSGDWVLGQTITFPSTKKIKAIDLTNDELAIATKSTLSSLYVEDNVIYATVPDVVYTYVKLGDTFNPSTVITGSMDEIDFGASVVFNKDLLIISSGYQSETYPLGLSEEYIKQFPLPKGALHHFKKSGSSFSPVGTDVILSSAPVEMDADENNLVIKLNEWSAAEVDSTVGFLGIEKTTFLKTLRWDASTGLFTDRGSHSYTPDAIYKAKPVYFTNNFNGIDQFSLSNGKISMGWRNAVGNGAIPLNGAIIRFDLVGEYPRTGKFYSIESASACCLSRKILKTYSSIYMDLFSSNPLNSHWSIEAVAGSNAYHIASRSDVYHKIHTQNSTGSLEFYGASTSHLGSQWFIEPAPKNHPGLTGAFRIKNRLTGAYLNNDGIIGTTYGPESANSYWYFKEVY